MSLDAIAALERDSERFICDWCGMRPAIVGQVTIDDDLVTFVLPCLECAMAAFAEWEQAQSSASGVQDALCGSVARNPTHPIVLQLQQCGRHLRN